MRVAEFDDLFASSVRCVDRLAPDRLAFELDPVAEVAARAADLAVRETECCSFFTFSLVATGGAVRLEVNVPVPYIPVLEALAARARSA